jgi:hypothetical protein
MDTNILPSKLDMILAYQKNQVKLVLLMLTTMEKCHF